MRRLAVTIDCRHRALALLLGGCGGGGGAGPHRIRIRQPGGHALRRSCVSAAAYVATASSIDLFEVKSAQLALQRAQDPANRAFAERVLSAHQGTSAQLSFARAAASTCCRRRRLIPNIRRCSTRSARPATSTTPIAPSRASSSQEGVKLHAGYAKSGDSPTLRPIAANAENVMRANLQALRRSR